MARILLWGAVLAGVFWIHLASHQNNAKFRIAVAVQGMTAEFMQLWVAAARHHPAVLDGTVALTIYDGKLDALNQLNQMQTIVARKFDAVIFIPVDAQAGVAAAAQARTAGIPVLGSNTLVSDRRVYTAYIGSDDVLAGRMVANIVVGRMAGRGNVFIIQGPIGHSAEIQRQQGILQVLAANPRIKLLAQRSANWSRSEALSLMENWLTAYPGMIGGVIAQNDEMALGALEALKARDIDPRLVPVAGIDGVHDALVASAHGQMTTVLQDATAQAQGSIDLALARLIGKSYQPRSDIWRRYHTQLNWDQGRGRNYMIPWTAIGREEALSLLAKQTR